MYHDNRRKFHRIDFEGMANLDFLNCRYECCPIKNLSLTGMYVEGNFKLQRIKNCYIKLFHNDKSGNNSLEIHGEVVWCNDKGAGFRFINMTLENYELLHEILTRNAEYPVIIINQIPKEFPYEVMLPN